VFDRQLPLFLSNDFHNSISGDGGSVLPAGTICREQTPPQSSGGPPGEGTGPAIPMPHRDSCRPGALTGRARLTQFPRKAKDPLGHLDVRASCPRGLRTVLRKAGSEAGLHPARPEYRQVLEHERPG
jgi:hypothetical protein